MAQAARLAARLQRELTMLHSDPPPGVSAWPCHDHLLTHLEAQVHGPQGTVYSNGIFKLDIQVPERYPFEPPNIKFVTPVYHPNIDNGGRICLDILNLPPKGAWRPSLNLSTVLASIGLLLAEPNPDDGLMGDITAEYKHDRSSFDSKARRWTQLYAGQDQVKAESDEANSSLHPQTSQNLAPVGSNSQESLQIAPCRGPPDIIMKCDPPSQPLKSGLSKRLTLDRGSTCLQQQDQPTSSTISCINNDKVQHAAAEVTVSPLDSGCSSLQANVCGSKEKLSRKEQSGNIAPDSPKVIGLADKSRFSSQVDNEEGRSCAESTKGLFHGIGGEKAKAILNVSNAKASFAERMTDVGNKSPRVHESCSSSISISSKMQGKVSKGSKTKISMQKVEDWEVIAIMGKENQPPKHCPAQKLGLVIPAETKDTAEIKPTDVSVGINSMTALNKTNISEPVKEKGYFALPSRTKSLKLARVKLDTQSFCSMASQKTIQSIPDEKKQASPPIIIRDDVPTVVVSDSGSDGELSDEGFTISLTQSCLSKKRKVGSKLR